jgi:hypothetical protein
MHVAVVCGTGKARLLAGGDASAAVVLVWMANGNATRIIYK